MKDYYNIFNAKDGVNVKTVIEEIKPLMDEIDSKKKLAASMTDECNKLKDTVEADIVVVTEIKRCVDGMSGNKGDISRIDSDLHSLRTTKFLCTDLAKMEADYDKLTEQRNELEKQKKSLTDLRQRIMKGIGGFIDSIKSEENTRENAIDTKKEIEDTEKKLRALKDIHSKVIDCRNITETQSKVKTELIVKSQKKEFLDTEYENAMNELRTGDEGTGDAAKRRLDEIRTQRNELAKELIALEQKSKECETEADSLRDSVVNRYSVVMDEPKSQFGTISETIKDDIRDCEDDLKVSNSLFKDFIEESEVIRGRGARLSNIIEKEFDSEEKTLAKKIDTKVSQMMCLGNCIEKKRKYVENVTVPEVESRMMYLDEKKKRLESTLMEYTERLCNAEKKITDEKTKIADLTFEIDGISIDIADMERTIRSKLDAMGISADDANAIIRTGLKINKKTESEECAKTV